MIMSDGTIVDTFYDFGAGGAVPDVVPGGGPERRRDAHDSRRRSSTRQVRSTRDLAQRWPHLVAARPRSSNNAGGYSPGVRCCLFAADIDPVTQRMYVAYHGGVGNTDPVYVIELRVLAHVAGEEVLREIFASDEDVHGATAAEVFAIPTGRRRPALEGEDGQLRHRLRPPGFGLADRLSISREEAEGSSTATSSDSRRSRSSRGDDGQGGGEVAR